MATEKKNNGYSLINPEDYLDYEDRFVDKAGGSGKGSGSGKGKKTLKAIKSQAIEASEESRRKAIEEKLTRFLNNTTERDNESYLDWVNQSLTGKYSLDPDEVEISFARSGGPGGQNVNKRETKVIALHRPTGTQASADQTRSQLENRQLVLGELESQLREHLDDWRGYLGSGRKVDKDLVDALHKKDL